MFVTIYITCVIINIIIFSIIIYDDYKNYVKITVSDIIMYIVSSLLSFTIIILWLASVWEYFKEDTPIISKKNNKSAIIIKYYG